MALGYQPLQAHRYWNSGISACLLVVYMYQSIKNYIYSRIIFYYTQVKTYIPMCFKHRAKSLQFTSPCFPWAVILSPSSFV